MAFTRALTDRTKQGPEGRAQWASRCSDRLLVPERPEKTLEFTAGQRP